MPQVIQNTNKKQNDLHTYIYEYACTMYINMYVYGNTGYGVSSPGIQTFCLKTKNQQTQRKLLNFEN